jgi:hypothetical protein
VNEISYNQRSLNVIEAEIEDKAKNKITYVFVTNIKITKRNANEIVCFGRSRWKIENEGFNNQKTKKYHIEHDYYNRVVIKVKDFMKKIIKSIYLEGV